MKLEIKQQKNKWENYFYISFNYGYYDLTVDLSIADELDIPLKKYNKILKKWGAYNKNLVGYCFHKKQDCEMAIQELEPYLVMKKLTSE